MQSVDISGFGGSYEAACQVMLFQGLEFLKDKPNFGWAAYKGYEEVYGLRIYAESDEAKALDEAICEGVEPTGAMHQAVISNLSYIHRHGHDAWIKAMQENGREIIEVDEDIVRKEILINQIEWQLKLDGGYNPIAELFRNIPPEDIIEVDVSDPKSIKAAAEEIARRIREADFKMPE